MVTPEGIPLADEGLPGNPAAPHAQRVPRKARSALRPSPPGVADGTRPPHGGGGEQRRASDPPGSYLLGTPQGKIDRAGKSPGGTPLGNRAQGRAGETPPASRRSGGAGPERRPRGQGTRQPPQANCAASARVGTNASNYCPTKR